MYLKREDTLEANNGKLYSVVWEQCSQPMQAKLRAHQEFEGLERTNDGVGLLIAIKSVMHHFNNTTHPYASMHKAQRALYTMVQGKGATDHDYECCRGHRS